MAQTIFILVFKQTTGLQKRSVIGIAHAAVAILHHEFRKQDQQQQEEQLLKQATLSLSL